MLCDKAVQAEKNQDVNKLRMSINAPQYKEPGKAKNLTYKIHGKRNASQIKVRLKTGGGRPDEVDKSFIQENHLLSFKNKNQQHNDNHEERKKYIYRIYWITLSKIVKIKI